MELDTGAGATSGSVGCSGEWGQPLGRRTGEAHPGQLSSHHVPGPALATAQPKPGQLCPFEKPR